MEKSENFNIETVVEKFFERAELFKTSTKTMLDLISQGRIPTKEQHEAFNKEFNEIEKCYKDIFNKAREINPDVNEDLSVEELKQIIKKHDTTLNKIDEAKKILNQFIQVKSCIERYTKALEPYQEEAKKLMQEINSQNCEKLLTSNPYRRAKYFIEALNNPDNDEAFDVIDEIYPKEVAKEVERGLLRNKYFLADTNSSELKIFTENELPEPAQEPDAEPELVQTEEPVPAVETQEENTTEAANADSNDSAKRNNIKTEQAKKKTKPISNHKMPDPAIMLSLVKKCTFITYDQAFRCFKYLNNKIPKRDIETWLDELNKDGFISTITLTSTKEKFFCLRNDPWVDKTLNKEEENEIIRRKKEIDSNLDQLEKTKSSPRPENLISSLPSSHKYSAPKANKPATGQTSAPEQPKQAEPAQAEPIKQEEEIPAQQDTTEQEKQSEPAEQTESETPVSEIPQPEDNEDRIEEEIIEEENTIEDSQKEEEIPSDDTETPETEPEQTENNDDALTTICNLIKSNKIYCATAYAKATKNPFYEVLTYAVDDPMAECTYSSDDIQKIQELNGMEDERDFIEPLIASAAMRAFFSARNTYDYTLQSLHDTIQGFEIVDSNTNLKNAIYDIFNFKKDNRNGLDSFVNQDNSQSFDEKLNCLKGKASDFIGSINPKIIKNQIFNKDFSQFLEHVKLGSKDSTIYNKISKFVKEFIGDGCEISKENIDDTKTETKIKKDWDKAREGKQNSFSTLGPKVKNDVLQQAKKALTILIDWINLIDEMPIESDKGTSDYKNSRKSMISDLEAAKEEINKAIDQNENHIKKYAGLKIVQCTLEEIQNCIEKNRSIEDSKKYFYIDFLLTPNIYLYNTNYIPNLNSFPSDPLALSPENRILKHADKVQNSSFEQFAERLDYILKNTGQNRGDDYGSAELILEYLKNTNHAPEDIDSIEKNIKDGKNLAKECTKEKKDNFVGELELSFAYGQLDNSSEDEILTDVNNWYNYSLDSFNYGFFFYVVDSYIEDIKVKAKHREKELLEDLEEFKKRKNDEFSVEEKQRIENKIKECIQDQNYTVAEDWLGNPEKILKDVKNVLDEDFLGNFVNNYSMYYTPIANMEKVFWVLVKPYIEKRNDAAEIMKMTHSWFSSYIDNNIGKEKLETLLNSLGFDEIVFEKDLEPIKVGSESYENYTIKSKKHSIFLHPIAALGSEMMREEIRIVCIKQQKDANQIMDIIEKIGKNNQHTLILLDCALSLSDRRILAKRSKDDLGNYLFAVIDRTVMMFMAMNYDNTKMNRMLMALIMPFTYYQPYVYSSVEDLPPEMFIGRKIELEKIEAVKGGVNIVYGGRQLGKTALLKRAEWDINKNNDNKKAVYISINTCDCEKAAKTILTELGKKKILDSDRIKKIREDKQKILGSETKLDDWDILKDAIGDRLNNNLPYKISYLLLLLDEADDFIKACDNVKFKPFLALEELQKNSKGQFKFVIAGLRDLVKFKEIVDTGNCPISHVDSLKVTPFNISEARELLEIPLHYLGLRFSKDKEGLKLLYLILANTNYFPGLIQMYCAIMLEIMHNKNENNSIGYNETDNPPYEITKDHVKKALYELNKKDEEGKDIIWKKLEITLNLGDDDYYHIIALVLASLHHEKNNKKGYSPKDIRDYSKALDIKKIAGMEIPKLKILLDELKGLNILKNTSDRNHYLFTRFNFFQKLGTKEEVEDKLLEKYMENKNENPENMVGTNTQS